MRSGITMLLTLGIVWGLSPVVFGELVYEPEISCKASTPGLSGVCIKGLMIQLGPTDGFVGYDPALGMGMFLLPYEGIDMKSLTPEQIKSKAVSSGLTNEEGDLSLVVSPAKYFFCVINSLPWYDEAYWNCREIMLEADVLRKIMVSQSPRGGKLFIEIKESYHGTK